MSDTERTVKQDRVRRFARSLWTDLRLAFRRRMRALRHPEYLGVLTALRRPWLVPDPAWVGKALGGEGSDPTLEAQRADSDRARAEARAARLREGPVAYTGELYVRAANRGIVLADLEGRPDIEAWLEQQFALDGYHGDSAFVRLTAELLCDEACG